MKTWHPNFCASKTRFTNMVWLSYINCMAHVNYSRVVRKFHTIIAAVWVATRTNK